MSNQNADIVWFRELLAGLGPIAGRRMFGGTGFYTDGLMIALEAFGTLYLKVDAQTRDRFTEAGGMPFIYEGKGKAVTMSYWTPPDDALDSPEVMQPWASLARDAAVRSAAAKSIGKNAAKTPVAKSRSTKKPATKKRVTPNMVAKKSAVEKPTVNKSAVKKTAAKKPPAKK